MTELHNAVANGNLSDVLKYIFEGKNMNVRGLNGTTCLHTAVKKGNIDMVELLLGMGNVDKDAIDNDGLTALHHAVNEKNEKMAKLLAERGVKLNVKNYDGLTAMSVALTKGMKSLANYLYNKWIFLPRISPQLYTCTTVKLTRATFYWTVEKFLDYRLESGDMIRSSEFTLGDEPFFNWHLELYPYGICEQDKDYISLFLVLDSSVEPKVKVKYKYSIINRNNIEMNIKKNVHDFELNSDWGYHQFVNRKYLFDEENNILSDGSLRISCELDLISCTNSSSNVKVMKSDSKLSSDFEEKFQTGKFSDVILIVGETKEEIPAHKFVLAARSPVFAAMLDNEMKEKVSNRIVIVDIEADIMRKLLQFMYSGKVDNLDNFSDRLLSAADKYDLLKLKRICEYSVASKLTVENCVKFLIFADLHSAKRLKKEAVRYIIAHAEEVMQKESWKAMTVSNPQLLEELFKTIIRREDNILINLCNDKI